MVPLPRWATDFLFTRAFRPALEAHPAPFSIGKGATLSGNEADFSPPPSVEVRNGWSRTSVLPYEFMIGRECTAP